MADNLGLITGLLQDALNGDGIEQLAFAEFRAVYDDFTPGMTNSQRIRMIVDHADRNGRIPDILYYVQTHNPFMFQKHAERLAPFYELPHERSEEEKLATYLAWVERQYGSLHLLDMGRKRPLQDVYTAVELLDKPEAYRYLDMAALQQGTTTEKRVDGLLLARQEKRLFVQGGPGVGKTTFLKHLALESADPQGKLPFVPVFVDLQMLADADKDLFGFVVDEFAIGGFPGAAPFVQRCVRDGRLLLLLDGLDELPVVDGQRKRVEKKIEQFERSQQNQNCHIILTCRAAAEHSRFKQFTHVQVAAFDSAQVKKFVSGWFYDDAVKKRNMFAALASTENKGIQELTQTPLLLALLCIAAEDTTRSTLFERRADVYQKAFGVLLHRWDDERAIERDSFYRDMSPARKQQLLAYVANETFNKSEKLIPLSRLQELLSAYLVTLPDAPPLLDIPSSKVLRDLVAQHGVFVERSRGIYAFAHLSFQEYFTAQYIVDNVQHGTLERLLAHVGNSRWREIFILTAGMLADATNFCQLYLQQTNNLIATEPQMVAILTWCEQKRESVQQKYKAAALRAYLLRRAIGISSALNLNPFISSTIYARASDIVTVLDHDLSRKILLAQEILGPFSASVKSNDDYITYSNSFLNNELIPATIYLGFRRFFRLCIRALSISREVANSNGYEEFQIALNKLILPENEEDWFAWNELGHNLVFILKKYQDYWDPYRQIDIAQDEFDECWQLSRSLQAMLAQYLEAKFLLTRCLQVACVPDLVAIEDQILLPPDC